MVICQWSSRAIPGMARSTLTETARDAPRSLQSRQPRRRRSSARSARGRRSGAASADGQFKRVPRAVATSEDARSDKFPWDNRLPRPVGGGFKPSRAGRGPLAALGRPAPAGGRGSGSASAGSASGARPRQSSSRTIRRATWPATRPTSASSGGGSGWNRKAPPRLGEGDGTALSASGLPLPASATTQRREDRAHEDAEHGARERGVVGEAVAQAEGQREHPLPDRDLRKNALHQVCGGVGHAAPAAGGTEAATLAREGDHAVETALVAVHAHEAVGEDAAAEERPELALDEARRRPLAGLRPGQEGLELRPHRPVQHARLGPARCVSGMSM